MIICYIKYWAKLVTVIGIEEFNNTEIFINTDDKFQCNITLKNVVILETFFKSIKYWQQISIA